MKYTYSYLSKLFFLCFVISCTPVQAYIVSASVWQYNDGKRVLLLGDCHLPGDPSQEHANLIQAKLEELNENDDKKAHFILEEFRDAGNKDVDDQGQTIEIIRNFCKKKNFKNIDVNKADYRPEHDFVDFTLTKIIDNNAYTDTQKLKKTFQEITQRIEKLKGQQLENVSVKNLVAWSAQIAYDSIFNLLEENKEKAKKYIREIDIAFNNILCASTIDRKIDGKSLRLLDLTGDTFVKFYHSFHDFNCLIADVGFILELEKNKQEYDYHIFFGGAAHESKIFQHLRDDLKAELLLNVEMQVPNNDFSDLSKVMPIDPVKLENMLNRSFEKNCLWNKICNECFKVLDEHMIHCRCFAGPFCSYGCKNTFMQHSRWPLHMILCRPSWRKIAFGTSCLLVGAFIYKKFFS